MTSDLGVAESLGLLIPLRPTLRPILRQPWPRFNQAAFASRPCSVADSLFESCGWLLTALGFRIGIVEPDAEKYLNP